MSLPPSLYGYTRIVDDWLLRLCHGFDETSDPLYTALEYTDNGPAYVEFLGSRYRGKEGVRRLYVGRFAPAFVGGRNGPVHGFLLDHPM